MSSAQLSPGDASVVRTVLQRHPMEREAADWYALACITLRTGEGKIFALADDVIAEAQLYATLALAAKQIGPPSP